MISGVRIQSLKAPPFFYCPSDGDGLDNRWTHTVTTTNYVGSEGYSWWQTSMLQPIFWNTPPRNYVVPAPAADYRGVFAPENTTKILDIKDGLSNTIILSEANATGYAPPTSNVPVEQIAWTCGTGLPRPKGETAVFRSAWVFTQYAGEIQQRWYCFPDGSISNGLGNQQWFLQKPYSFTPTYITTYGPNSDWPGPSSFHKGIVLAARALPIRSGCS
jgi:hypothetical protein